MKKGTFFLPWQEDASYQVHQKQLYFPSREAQREDVLCFQDSPVPSFSLPNSKGTVVSFLEALKAGKREEAANYLSFALKPYTDLTELDHFLENMSSYRLYGADQKEKSCKLVLLAHQKGSREPAVLSFHLVAEPTSRGKWKICQIVKE